MAVPHTRHRLAASLLALISAFATWHLVTGWQLWLTGETAVVSAIALVGAAVALVLLWRGSPARRLVASMTLLLGAALMVMQLFGWLLPLAKPGPVPYTLLLVAVCCTAGIGMLARWRIARWIAIGFGTAGAVSSGLNLAQWVRLDMCNGHSWTFAIWLISSLVIALCSSGADLAEQDRSSDASSVWSRPDPLVVWMRRATITALIAGMMLIVYGTFQHFTVAAVADAAPFLAAVLLLGAALAACGRIAGGLVLSAGAVALAVIATVAVASAPDGPGLQIAGYYLVFWVPAIVSGLGCAAALIAAAARR